MLKLAHHGDATTDLLGVQKRTRLVEALAEARNGNFDAILFSGGGNDMVGNQFRLWLDDAPLGLDPAGAINQSALDDILGVVKTAYLDLIAARNSVARARGIPIKVKAKDLALQTCVGVCGVGPWLLPSLQSRGWMTAPSGADLDRGAAIVKLILEQFQAFLKAVAADKSNNVALVCTQGILEAGDWANELHPNPGGFHKITDRFVARLETLFPGRLLPSVLAGNQGGAVGGLG